MKKIFLLFILLSSTLVSAQETTVTSEESPAAGESNQLGPEKTLSFGLNFAQWNEQMELQSGTLSAKDKANFRGLQLRFEKKFPSNSTEAWNLGWALGANIGHGIASGGGNSTTAAYQKGNQEWNSAGVFGKVYTRMTDQFNLGLVVPVMYRQITWPKIGNSQPVDSGKNVNVGLLMEIEFHLSKSFSFYQDLGTFGTEGATLWQLGLGYRM